MERSSKLWRSLHPSRTFHDTLEQRQAGKGVQCYVSHLHPRTLKKNGAKLMLPKHYSAIHLLTTSPSKPKKLLITKLRSCTQQNTVFLCTSFFASTSVYIWGSLLSIPNLFFLTLSRPCVSLPLTQAANVFKYTDNCIGQVCDGNDNQATAIHGFT